MSYVLGRASSVSADMTTRVNQTECEDCISASLEMANGSLCSLSVTTGSPAEISRHRFCFSNLSAESNTEPYRNSSDPWKFTGDAPEIDDRIEEVLCGFVPLPERFAGQFYRFHDAVQSGTDLPVTLADARAAIELITVLYHAARTHQPGLPADHRRPSPVPWLAAVTDSRRG